MIWEQLSFQFSCLSQRVWAAFTSTFKTTNNKSCTRCKAFPTTCKILHEVGFFRLVWGRFVSALLSLHSFGRSLVVILPPRSLSLHYIPLSAELFHYGAIAMGAMLPPIPPSIRQASQQLPSKKIVASCLAVSVFLCIFAPSKQAEKNAHEHL